MNNADQRCHAMGRRIAHFLAIVLGAKVMVPAGPFRFTAAAIQIATMLAVFFVRTYPTN